MNGIETKGEIMKTIALLALLTFGLITAAGCHWGHNRHHYSDGYYTR
jgi:hypothetical protein